MVIDGSYNDINKYPHLFNLVYNIVYDIKFVKLKKRFEEIQLVESDSLMIMYVCISVDTKLLKMLNFDNLSRDNRNQQCAPFK